MWIILATIAAFLVAWVNGANNAANAIGTAVGSKALTLKKALILTATFDFVGAILFGRFVSKTLLKGIVDIHAYTNPYIVMYGMFCALLATGLWVIAATWFKIPMSISQAIVGGVMGLGLGTLGPGVIDWGKISIILFSWYTLPFFSGLVAIGIYYFMSKYLAKISINKLPIMSVILFAIFVFTTVFLLSVKTMKMSDLVFALKYSIGLALALSVPFYIIFKHKMPKTLEGANRYTYRALLIMAAATMAFSHGANDVANSAGPLTGVLIIAFEHRVPAVVSIPMEVLALCAAGIAIGILMWGYKVVETIGEKITTLTVQTAFIAQFSASIAVLIVTRLGLPVSTTVAIVGAVAGIGFAKGVKNVNIKLLMKIITVWTAAVPVVALMSAIFLRIILYFMPPIF